MSSRERVFKRARDLGFCFRTVAPSSGIKGFQAALRDQLWLHDISGTLNLTAFGETQEASEEFVSTSIAQLALTLNRGFLLIQSNDEEEESFDQGRYFPPVEGQQRPEDLKGVLAISFEKEGEFKSLQWTPNGNLQGRHQEVFEKITSLQRRVFSFDANNPATPESQEFFNLIRGTLNELPNFDDPFHFPAHWRRIGFVGESQAGKSSLMNALLSEKDSDGDNLTFLPTGVQVASCTNVPISLYWKDQEGFTVTVKYISKDEWKAQILDFLRNPGSNQDLQSSLRELYPPQAHNWNPQQLPKDPISMETFASEMANQIEDFGQSISKDFPTAELTSEYLLGVATSTSSENVQGEGNEKSVLIESISVCGRFEHLPPGVIMVDCPGLLDRNPNRTRRAHTALAECNTKIIVANTLHNVTAQSLVTCALQGSPSPSNVFIVIAKLDSVTQRLKDNKKRSALLANFQSIGPIVRASLVSVMKTLTVGDDLRAVRTFLNNSVQSETRHQRAASNNNEEEEAPIIAPVDNSSEILDETHQQQLISAASLTKVFPVSSMIFDQMNLNGNWSSLTDPELSGIPELQRSLFHDPFVRLQRLAATAEQRLNNAINGFFRQHLDEAPDPHNSNRSELIIQYLDGILQAHKQPFDDLGALLDGLRPQDLRTLAIRAHDAGIWNHFQWNTWRALTDSFRKGIFYSTSKLLDGRDKTINLHRDVANQLYPVVGNLATRALVTEMNSLAEALSWEPLALQIPQLAGNALLQERFVQGVHDLRTEAASCYDKFTQNKLFQAIYASLSPLFSDPNGRGASPYDVVTRVETSVLPHVIRGLHDSLSFFRISLMEFPSRLSVLIEPTPTIPRNLESLAAVAQACLKAGIISQETYRSFGVAELNQAMIDERKKGWIASLYDARVGDLFSSASAFRSVYGKRTLAEKRQILTANKPALKEHHVWRINLGQGMPQEESLALSLKQWGMATQDDLHGRLYVTSVGPSGPSFGMDAGGLTNEMFSVTAGQITSLKSYLFTSSEDDLAYFNPNVAGEELDSYIAVGRFLGRVIYQELPVPLGFSLALYKILTGQDLRSPDHASAYKDRSRQLLQYKDLDPTELGLFFEPMETAIEHANKTWHLGVPFGMGPSDSDGSAIPLNASNLDDYIELQSSFSLVRGVRPHIRNFLRGVNEVIPLSLLTMFTATELCQLVEGHVTVDADQLIACLRFQGAPNPNMQQWLRNILTQFTSAERVSFLQFVTARTRLPSHPLEISILISGSLPPGNLPVSHTCFSRLDVPIYSSQQDFSTKLRASLTHGLVGFGIA